MQRPTERSKYWCKDRDVGAPNKDDRQERSRYWCAERKKDSKDSCFSLKSTRSDRQRRLEVKRGSTTSPERSERTFVTIGGDDRNVRSIGTKTRSETTNEIKRRLDRQSTVAPLSRI